jgi:hypothetical protein
VPTTLDALTIADRRRALLWCGDESVTIREALDAIAAGERASAENASEQERATAARQAWLDGRAQASRDAYSEAYARARGSAEHLGDPQWAVAGRQAAHEAIVAYEREHELPPGLPTAILREPPPPRNLMQRAVAKTLELVS